VNTSIIELPARRSRRRHPAEFKRRIVQACQQGGISIAAVALANGLNANMVRKWVIEAEGTQPPGRPSAAKVGPRRFPSVRMMLRLRPGSSRSRQPLALPRATSAWRSAAARQW
jgi:transposase-like protein